MPLHRTTAAHKLQGLQAGSFQGPPKHRKTCEANSTTIIPTILTNAILQPPPPSSLHEYLFSKAASGLLIPHILVTPQPSQDHSLTSDLTNSTSLPSRAAT